MSGIQQKRGFVFEERGLSKMEEKEVTIERWQKFHQENAELQIVSKSENLSELKEYGKISNSRSHDILRSTLL